MTKNVLYVIFFKKCNFWYKKMQFSFYIETLFINCKNVRIHMLESYVKKSYVQYQIKEVQSFQRRSLSDGCWQEMKLSITNLYLQKKRGIFKNSTCQMQYFHMPPNFIIVLILTTSKVALSFSNDYRMVTVCNT